MKVIALHPIYSIITSDCINFCQVNWSKCIDTACVQCTRFYFNILAIIFYGWVSDSYLIPSCHAYPNVNCEIYHTHHTPIHKKKNICTKCRNYWRTTKRMKKCNPNNTKWMNKKNLKWKLSRSSKMYLNVLFFVFVVPYAKSVNIHAYQRYFDSNRFEGLMVFQ